MNLNTIITGAFTGKTYPCLMGIIRKKTIYFLLFLLFGTTGCSKENNVEPNVDKTGWWKPAAGISFDWDLNKLNADDSFSAEVVDVDAFETSAETINTLHAHGKKVIAYLSVGTIENSRPDSNLLPADIIGNVYTQWPDEKWIDIRQINKLKPWLISRFTMIKNKGFDAIEPDNLDGYNNNTGFALNLDDTKSFCDYLIGLAHSMNMGIGQKNVSELTAEFSNKFDWALTEDAFNQGWQNQMIPYIDKNKPVFVVEYTDITTQQTFENVICPLSKKMSYSAILKNRQLDKWTDSCR